MKKIDLNKIERLMENELNTFKISTGAIRRMLVTTVSGLIQIISVSTGQNILVNNQLIDSTVGIVAIGISILLVVYQYYCCWKNNSFTKSAIIGDKLSELLREDKETKTEDKKEE